MQRVRPLLLRCRRNVHSGGCSHFRAATSAASFGARENPLAQTISSENSEERERGRSPASLPPFPPLRPPPTITRENPVAQPLLETPSRPIITRNITRRRVSLSKDIPCKQWHMSYNKLLNYKTTCLAMNGHFFCSRGFSQCTYQASQSLLATSPLYRGHCKRKCPST